MTGRLVSVQNTFKTTDGASRYSPQTTFSWLWPPSRKKKFISVYVLTHLRRRLSGLIYLFPSSGYGNETNVTIMSYKPKQHPSIYLFPCFHPGSLGDWCLFPAVISQFITGQHRDTQDKYPWMHTLKAKERPINTSVVDGLWEEARVPSKRTHSCLGTTWQL